MAVRFRAHLRYTPGSGMARWVADQMQVRLGMAFHLREDTPQAEMSHVTADIVTSGPQANRRENVTIDVIWPDDRDDLATDTWATILGVAPWIRPDGPEPDGPRSWMDWHRCRHDQPEYEPCPAPEQVWP